MDIQIVQVPAVELIARWNIIEPLLDKAMPVAMKRYLPVDILAMVIQAQAQAWLVKEGAEVLAVAITTVYTYPRRRGLSVFALAGSRMSEWFQLAEEVFTAFARQMGCDHFECQGRRGWEKVLDLEPRATLLVKDLFSMEAPMQ